MKDHKLQRAQNIIAQTMADEICPLFTPDMKLTFVARSTDDPRWREDIVITNHDGDRVWLKPVVVDDKQIGITDCCFEKAPCAHHVEVAKLRVSPGRTKKLIDCICREVTTKLANPACPIHSMTPRKPLGENCECDEYGDCYHPDCPQVRDGETVTNARAPETRRRL